MLDYERLNSLALECGFSYCGPLKTDTLEFLQEVRDMCASDKCHNFNKSWACPPACGTLEEMRERVKAYSEGGILVQTVGQLEDSYDWEGIQDAAMKQRESFEKLYKILKKEYPKLMPMGTGGCSKCKTCTYPDNPCRFPDDLVASMEACGLFVSKTCTDNGLKYNYGPNTIAYTACFLLE